MKRWVLILVLTGLIIMPAIAQTTYEDKYIEEFDKLKGITSYVVRNGDFLEYSIIDYDINYQYFIRVYSIYHAQVLQEYPIKEPVGKIPFTYPGFAPVYVNLQKQIPDYLSPEEADKLCSAHTYLSSWGQPCCDVRKNLDITSISINKNIKEPDLYTSMIRFWTRAPTSKITGASWQASQLAGKL